MDPVDGAEEDQAKKSPAEEPQSGPVVRGTFIMAGGREDDGCVEESIYNPSRDLHSQCVGEST